MVHEYEAAHDVLAHLVGCRVLEDTVELNPRVARRGGMTWIGDNSPEIGQPISGHSPTARFVSRHGSGVNSVAVQVSDLEATAAHLETHGVRFTWADPTFGFSHPHDVAGLLIEWFEGPVECDPRRGGAACPLVRSVTFSDPHSGRGEPRAGVSLRDMTSALFERSAPEQSVDVWGVELDIPRVHAFAVLVPDLDVARATLQGEAIEVAYDTGELLVLPLQGRGDVCVVVTDRLLPGDPRSSS